MSDSSFSIVGIMTGDLKRDQAALIKYGPFFDSIGRHFNLLDVHDVSLQGAAKLWNALQVFHPNPAEWKKRYWINVPAYRARSKLAARYLSKMRKQADLAIQISTIFDPNVGGPIIPTVIYTDYTVRLSALRPDAGRAPLSPVQLERWVALETLAYQQAAHVFTRARFVRESIVRDYGIAPDHVTAVGGGVNFATMPAYISRSEDDDPVVLFIGRDFYRKGGDLMLQAFHRTRQEWPSARLLFLTRDLIPADFPLDGVEVVSSAWDRKVIDQCFQRANIFVLPSRLETWGDVLLEAMAYGLACIGTSEEPMNEIIEQDRTGLCVLPEDVNALEAGLLSLFRDGSLRTRLGSAAREHANSFYTWDCVVDRMATVIQSMGVSSKGV